MAAPLQTDAASEIAAALYAASATQAAFKRQADKRIKEQRSEIEALRLQVALGEKDEAASQAELAKMRRALAKKETEIVEKLAEQDRAYAQEIAVFRNAVEDIAATSEGLRALEMFNDGDQLGAIAILDDLRAARNAARLVRANIESASEARSIAELAMEARANGKLTTADLIARFEDITTLDPGVHWDWIELSRLYIDFGDLTGAEFAAIQAAATGENDHDRSVALNELGNISQKQGNLPTALKNFRDSLTIAKRLSDSDPSNTHLKRNLSISYNNIGDLHAKQGNYSAAKDCFSKSLNIRKRLTTFNPENALWQSDLASSYGRMGKFYLTQNNLAEALQNFESALIISKRLSVSTPNNSIWQRNVSVLYNRVGDIFIVQDKPDKALENFESSLAIRERLVATDPGNAGWQRDLSVSYNKVGLASLRQNNRSKALQNFGHSLDIRKRLSESDPYNTEWQMDLAVGYERLGILYFETGNFVNARYYWERQIILSEKLVKAEPTNVKLPKLIVVARLKLYTLEESDASEQVLRAYAAWKPLADNGLLPKSDRQLFVLLNNAVNGRAE